MVLQMSLSKFLEFCLELQKERGTESIRGDSERKCELELPRCECQSGLTSHKYNIIQIAHTMTDTTAIKMPHLLHLEPHRPLELLRLLLGQPREQIRPSEGGSFHGQNLE